MPKITQTPLDSSFKESDLLIERQAKKYNIDKDCVNELKEGVHRIIIELHNDLHKDIKDEALTEISKVLDRLGYKASRNIHI